MYRCCIRCKVIVAVSVCDQFPVSFALEPFIAFLCFSMLFLYKAHRGSFLGEGSTFSTCSRSLYKPPQWSMFSDQGDHVLYTEKWDNRKVRLSQVASANEIWCYETGFYGSKFETGNCRRVAEDRNWGWKEDVSFVLDNRHCLAKIFGTSFCEITSCARCYLNETPCTSCCKLLRACSKGSDVHICFCMNLRPIGFYSGHKDCFQLAWRSLNARI